MDFVKGSLDQDEIEAYSKTISSKTKKRDGDNLTSFDDTAFTTRIAQIVGLKLPKVFDVDLAIKSYTTVKNKLRREMDTILK